MDQREKLNELLAQYKPDKKLYSIIKKDPDLLSWISEQVPDSTRLSEQIYCIMHNEKLICEHGKRRQFNNSWAGFYMCGRTTCQCWKENQSNKLKIAKNSLTTEEWDEIIEKRKVTNLEKYGTEFAVQSDIVKDKVEKANIEKYGVKTTLLVPEVQEKIKNSLIDHFGVDHPSKSKEIKKKAMDTCLEKYGHVVYPHSIEGRPIVRQTLKDKYNVTSISQLKFSQPVRDLLQDTKRFHDEYFDIGINGLCGKYPELNYDMCRSKLLREGITDVIRFSKPELFIKDFLDENNIDYEYNTRKIIAPLELDFYLPKHKLAIEVCGLYWHRHSLLDNQKYHVQKLENCLSKDIKLITIFSDQIEEKPEIVLQRLKFKLKLMPRLFHARELVITDSMNKSNVGSFINEYHIQGNKSGSVNIVATHNGFICAAMTFGPLRRSMGQKTSLKDNYEMYRFATAGNIPGVASRCFSFFIKHYNPTYIISYSDRCWGEGDLYSTLGFTKVAKNGPNYWYTKDFVHKTHRFGFTKHSLVTKGFDSNLTEHQIMTSRGYDRIYDCGSNKYEWKV